jgi:hypothetical protein
VMQRRARWLRMSEREPQDERHLYFAQQDPPTTRDTGASPLTSLR